MNCNVVSTKTQMAFTAYSAYGSKNLSLKFSLIQMRDFF